MQELLYTVSVHIFRGVLIDGGIRFTGSRQCDKLTHKPVY